MASEDLAALAKFKTEALNKNLGDTGDWQQAEARWATMGVELADIENWNKINLFYDKTVARVGTPNGELIWVRPPRPRHPLIKTFHRLFLSATNPRIKSRLARVLAGELSGTGEYYKEIGEALEYYASASPFAALNITMGSVLASPGLPGVPLDVLDCIGRAVQVNDLVFQARWRAQRDLPTSTLGYLVNAYKQNFALRGLSPLIMAVGRAFDDRHEIVSAISKSDLISKDNDTDAIKFSVACLAAFSSERPDEFVRNFADLVDCSAGVNAHQIFEEILRMRQLNAETIRAAILSAFQKHSGDDLGEQLIPLLRGSLDRRHTALEVKEYWCELGFPPSLYFSLVKLSKAQSATL